MKVTEDQLEKLIHLLWCTCSMSSMVGGMSQRQREEFYDELHERKVEKTREHDREGFPDSC